MKLARCLTIIIFLLYSLAVNAETIKIINDTNEFIAFRINDVCSKGLSGLNVAAHSSTSVEKGALNHLCKKGFTKCVARSFYKPNCAGAHIADIALDSEVGVVGVSFTRDSDLNTKVNGDKLQLIFTSIS